MNDSITICRIAGVRIGVNWSWLVVFGLITWSLAEAVFPETNPGRSTAVYVAMAVVAALLFFISLLLHELGHAVQARRDGMVIEGITLWLFGGVAKFRGMFPSAWAELRIALAGPAVSAVLALAFLGAGWLLPLPDVVDGVVTWLGVINVTLLIFNMLPALPLDGGRVLRSLLWAGRRDFAWATRIASNIGRAFGVLIVAAGGVMLALWGALGGIWLALIGWFLFQAAGAEQRALTARTALGGLRVRDLMITDPVCATPDETLDDFAYVVVRPDMHTGYPVVDESGRAVGLLTLQALSEIPREDWRRHLVRERMLPAAAVPRFGEGDDAYDALTRIGAGGVGKGLVVRGDLLVGLLTLTDITRAFELRRLGLGDAPPPRV